MIIMSAKILSSALNKYLMMYFEKNTTLHRVSMTLTMMMATRLEHELGSCGAHDGTWGPR